MKSKLSVWQWPYSKGYYLLRPWKWLKQLWLNIGDAHDRATKGYCRTDWYEFDNWFITLAPQMLRDIADKGCGYPGREPFEEPEKWHKWLHDMADKIEQCDEEVYEHNNEYEEAFMKMYENIRISNKTENGWTSSFVASTPEEKELRDKYFARQLELSEQREQNMKDCLSELGEHYFSLWD